HRHTHTPAHAHTHTHTHTNTHTHTHTHPHLHTHTPTHTHTHTYTHTHTHISHGANTEGYTIESRLRAAFKGTVLNAGEILLIFELNSQSNIPCNATFLIGWSITLS